MKRVVLLAPALFLALAAACAPVRYRIAGEEAVAAAALFAAATPLEFPVRASFSGYAELPGKSVPLVAGENSREPSSETVGLYDPLGRPFLFVENDGHFLRFARGAAAGDALPDRLPVLPAGPVSIARVLSGAAGYPLSGMEAARGKDGGFILYDKRQTLFSDPARRVLSRAEYTIGGKRFVVSYPGRSANGVPPATVEIEGMGGRIVLRRDAE